MQNCLFTGKNDWQQSKEGTESVDSVYFEDIDWFKLQEQT